MSFESNDAGAMATAHEFFKRKKVVMEVGPGSRGGTYVVDTEHAHDAGVVYVAVDKNTQALKNIYVPQELPAQVATALKDISSRRDFIDSDFFDASVDLLYAFNVLDTLPNIGDYQKLLAAVVSKFGRMLKPGGKIVLAHWYTPAFAHEVAEFDYKRLGFTHNVYRGDACKPALCALGFTEHLAEQCVQGGDSSIDGSVPFVVVLKNDSDEKASS